MELCGLVELCELPVWLISGALWVIGLVDQWSSVLPLWLPVWLISGALWVTGLVDQWSLVDLWVTGLVDQWSSVGYRSG